MSNLTQRNSRIEMILNFLGKDKFSNFPNDIGSSLLTKQLRQFYIRDPLIKFLTLRPILAGFTAWILGFVFPTTINWWNGTLLWSNSKDCMNTFLSQPVDWVYLFLLMPIGLGIIGNYYISLYHSMISLIAEKRIDAKKTAALLKLYKKKHCLTIGPIIICWLILIPLAFFFWVMRPCWTPTQVTCWYTNVDGRPSIPGFVMYLLLILEIYVLLTFVIDTFRFNVFHNDLLYNKHTDTFESSIKFDSYHPDKIYGYAPLAKPINYAIIISIITLIVLAFFGTGNFILRQKFDRSVIVTFAIETIGILLLLPWIIIGPIWPFISMLCQKKEEQLQKLRILLAKSLDDKSRLNIINEWTTLQQGWPLIIEKRSIGIFIATILLTQASQLGPILIRLIRIFMPWA